MANPNFDENEPTLQQTRESMTIEHQTQQPILHRHLSEIIDFEEEVEYVVMQYPELPQDMAVNVDDEDKFTVTGIDENEPFIKIGDTVFRGEWKPTFGSMLVFEKSADMDGVETVSLVGSSRRGVLLTAVDLRPKDQMPLDATGDCIR